MKKERYKELMLGKIRNRYTLYSMYIKSTVYSMEVCVRYSYLLREVGETLVSEVEKGWLLLLLLLTS